MRAGRRGCNTRACVGTTAPLVVLLMRPLPMLSLMRLPSLMPQLGQLGLLGHDRYKVTALMDGLSMVTVTTEKYGTFNCKPLQASGLSLARLVFARVGLHERTWSANW